MVDVADPTEDFSVARYQEMAESCIADIQARGHRALLVGGTGLYLRALRQPMAMGEAAADESIRQELQQIADAPGGKEQLHQQLAAVDPDTAQRLHLNDVRRVILPPDGPSVLAAAANKNRQSVFLPRCVADDAA